MQEETLSHGISIILPLMMATLHSSVGCAGRRVQFRSFACTFNLNSIDGFNQSFNCQRALLQVWELNH